MTTNEKQFIAQEIRAQYVKKQSGDVERLMRLDAQVKRPASIFAFSLGIISALILGFGMSLIMTDIGKVLGVGSPLATGIVIGIVGMLGAAVSYPVYKKILRARKSKYADKIIALSDSVINNA